MELKRINRDSSANASAENLQHEVVSKIEARYEAECRQARRRKRAQRIKSLLSLLFYFTILSGLAYFVWFRWFNESGVTPVANLLHKEAEEGEGPAVVESASGMPALPVTSSVNVQLAENLSTYVEIERSFSGASLYYWKNAPEMDRPDKAKEPLTFICLVLANNGGKEYYELTTSPGRPMSVRRLLPSVGWQDYPLAEFKKIMAAHALFMKREDRVYFCSPSRKKKKGRTSLVPKEREAFECGKTDFVELFAIAVSGKFATPRFSYEVSFRPAATKTIIKVGAFPLGTKLLREDFVKAAARANLPDFVVDGAEILVSVQSNDIGK